MFASIHATIKSHRCGDVMNGGTIPTQRGKPGRLVNGSENGVYRLGTSSTRPTAGDNPGYRLEFDKIRIEMTYRIIKRSLLNTLLAVLASGLIVTLNYNAIILYGFEDDSITKLLTIDTVFIVLNGYIAWRHRFEQLSTIVLQVILVDIVVCLCQATASVIVYRNYVIWVIGDEIIVYVLRSVYYSPVVVAVVLFLYRKARQRRKEGMVCLECDYDLRGTIDAGRHVCPECGTKINQKSNDSVCWKEQPKWLVWVRYIIGNREDWWS